MASHRRTVASAFFKTTIIDVFYLASLLLPAIDAYSILPATTRETHKRLQWMNQRSLSTNRNRGHWQSPSSPPLPLERSLGASRSFDFDIRNATDVTYESGLLDDHEDMQLLRFMEEAFLELESYQTSAHNEDLTIHRDPHFEFSSESKTTNKNSEPSLLFPLIEAGATAATATTFNDSSVALSGIDVPRADSNDYNMLRPKDKTHSASDAVDEDAIWRARWLLIGAAALYGTNFSVVKLLGDEMPVGISTSLRFGLAALATLPWLVQGFLPKLTFGKEDDFHHHVSDSMEHQTANGDRRIMATLYGLEVGLWNSIGYVAQAVGLETTLASESAFLCSMAVVIVPLLDWIAGKRLLSRQWVGALMALVGVAFLELGDVNALFSSNGGVSGISTGDQLSLIQPFTFGLGFWRMEQAMNRCPEEAPRMTAAQLMAIFISSVGYGLWTVGVFEPFFSGDDINLALAGFQSSLAAISTSFPWREWSTDPSILFSLFWTGCITTALTIYMETLALESLSAAETTLIFSTEPLWGTAFAVALMGEQMGLNAIVGAGLILTACVYSNLGVHGLQEMWTSTMKNISPTKITTMIHEKNADTAKSSSSLLSSLQDHWPWLSSGLAGSLAARNIASDAGYKTEELDEIVEELMENLVDKL